MTDGAPDIPEAAWEAEKARLKAALWGDSSSSSSMISGFKITSLMVQVRTGTGTGTGRGGGLGSPW